MGITSGPKIASESLIYVMDPANPRSFKGSGTVMTNIGRRKKSARGSNTQTHGGSSFNRRGVGCFSMDGTDDYISVPDSDDLSALSAFTICAWVRPTNNKNFWILSKGIRGTGNREFGMLLNHSARAEIIIADESENKIINATSRFAIPNNEWHYVVATWSGSQLKIFVDGQRSGPVTNTNYVIENLSADLYIGRSHGSASSDFSNGDIGSVHIYNSVLSDQEINSNYFNGRGRYAPSERGVPKFLRDSDRLVFDCVTDSHDGHPKISFDLFQGALGDPPREVVQTYSVYDGTQSIQKPAEGYYTWSTLNYRDRTGGPYDFIIDWGDGSVERVSRPSGTSVVNFNNRNVASDRHITHQYSASGTYKISIDGQIDDFVLGKVINGVVGNINNSGQADTTIGNFGIVGVDSWGQLKLKSNASLYGTRKALISVPEAPAMTGVDIFTLPATKSPDIEGVFGLFENAALNQSIDHWDWSQVDKLDGLFKGCNVGRSFNADTSHVKSFNSMYSGATFKDGIYMSGIDISSMVSGVSMFFGAKNNPPNVSGLVIPSGADTSWLFCKSEVDNPSIPAMDVSQATTMKGWFAHYVDFDQDISGWDVSKVTDMSALFFGCGISQDLSSWDTSSVVDMSDMFQRRYIRRQPYIYPNITNNISGWNLPNLQKISRMFMDNHYYTHSADFLVSSGVKEIGGHYLGSDPYISRQGPWFGSGMPVDLNNWDTCTVENFNSLFRYVTDGYIYLSGNTSGMVGSSAKDTGGMFYGFSNTNLTHDFSTWDMSSVENTREMFYSTNTSAITNTDYAGITDWDVSSIKNAKHMFRSQSQFNQDLSGWNLSSLEDAYGMFQLCSAYNSPVPTFPTGVNLAYLFNNCSSFNQDLSHISFAGSYMNNMLEGTNMSASNINAINPSGGLNRQRWLPASYNGSPPDVWRSGQHDFNYLFSSLSSFNQDISSWDTSHVTNMEGMFMYATAFNRDISSWDVGKVTNFKKMFYGCGTTYNVNSWQPPDSVTDIQEMFFYASNSLTNINLSSFDVSNCKSFRGLFAGTAWNNHPRLASGGSWLNAWDSMTAQVTDFQQCFKDNWYNSSIAIENWNVGSGTNFAFMLQNSQANRDITGWDMSSATVTSAMLKYNYNFNRDISDWDVSNVTSFSEMLYGARVLNCDISKWDFSGINTSFALYRFFKRGENWSANAFSKANYDKLLQKWHNHVASGDFGTGSRQYFVEVDSYYSSDGAAARTSLVNDYLWSITDRGQQ